MSDEPRRLELTPEELKALLERVKAAVSESDYEAVKAMADTIEALSRVLDQKATSIKRLLKLLFGQKSEKKNKVSEDSPGTNRTLFELRPNIELVYSNNIKQ